MKLLVALLLTGVAVILQDCLVSSTCPFATAPNCQPPTYYQSNGQCNNLVSKFAGSEASPLSRYLSFLATGGTGRLPYKSFYGHVLPSPRKVSVDLFPCQGSPASSATHLFTIFGHLLMYDLFNTERENSAETCCSGCLGIEHTGSTDQRIKANCEACMPYSKPLLSYNLKCTDRRQGKNQVTHVIDASFMYSSFYFNGALSNGKFNLNSGFLPISGKEFIGVVEPLRKNPLLMALYHVWIREHNKLVDKMTEFNVANPSDEAKKLLIGIFQHITYNEYLPMLLGASTPIKSQTTGTRTYDDNVLPVVSNSFSLAYELAMASMLRETVNVGSAETLLNIMDDATKVDTDSKITNIINGMLGEASSKIDGKISCSFRDNCQYSDIVSVLTQDTRYLGIPPYFVFLATTGKTGLTPETVTSFSTLPYHDSPTQTLLSETYKNIYDIDFLAGTFSEKISGSDNLGTTAKQMFENQFLALQKGDRFYYESTNVFNSAQLTEIRKATMALLLCRNVASLSQVKQHAFEMNSTPVSCSTIPEIDFCNYADISRTWTAFQPSSTECYQFKIEYRNCNSAKPIQCPCPGDPLKLTPCPNSMVTPETNVILQLLAKKLSNDSNAMSYYARGDMKKVEEIAKKMYMDMTQA